MSSSDTEITSLGDFLASLAAEVPIQPPTPSAMDGDLETVLALRIFKPSSIAQKPRKQSIHQKNSFLKPTLPFFEVKVAMRKLSQCINN